MRLIKAMGSQDTILATVETQGFCFIDHNVLDLDIKKLRHWFADYFGLHANESKYKDVAVFAMDELSENRLVKDLLKKIVTLTDLTSANGFYLDKIWLVHSLPRDEPSDSLPYVPHFDKHRYVKVMIYLDDVSLSDGPFHSLSFAPIKNEEKRLNLSKNYKYNGENTVKDISVDDFIPCVGCSGSIVIFDTNCPHFAGSINGEGHRRVLRFDFDNRMFHSRARNVFSRIRSILGQSIQHDKRIRKNIHQ